MTKNNLASHLKWLLKQGPSLYPSLTTEAPVGEQPARFPQQPTPPDEFDIPDEILEDADDAADETMARLMLCPSSENKPRMLSQPVKNHDAPSATVKKPSSSPRSMATANSYLDPKPASSLKNPRPKATPLKSDRKLETSPFDGIESIDLTGEISRFLPSSEKVDLGEPRRLWTEGANSRDDTREKRGKKRKSEEYTSDLLSPSKHSTKIRTPSKANRPHLSGNAATELPASSSRDVVPSATKQSRRVIADSDDEDEDDPFDSWLGAEDVDDMIIDPEPSLYPKLPDVSSQENQKSEPHSSVSGPSSSDMAPPPMRTEKKTPLPKTQNLEPSPTPKPSSSQQKDPDILKFLALSSTSITQAISSLKKTLQKNAEIVYEQAMEGRPAPDLIAANKNLVLQIQSIESLKTSQDSHKSCLSRKEDLKKNLMRVISQGIDPTTMPELAQSRAVEGELEKIEANIRELLPRSKIFDVKLSSEAGDIDMPMGNSRPISSHQSPPHDLFDDSVLSIDSPPAAFRTEHRSEPPQQSSFANPRERRDYPTDRPQGYQDRFVARNMGSPPLAPAMEFDDFDWNASDDEMLEVAGSFDDGAASTKEAMSQSRPVFAETSGNTSRMPAPKKSPGRSNFWSNHPWSQEVKTVLKDKFHLRGFRPNQLEAIDATLAGKDTFILMPTGGGKSLCYQLPSIVTTGKTQGVTLVVSPLLSLMQDQVDHLRELNISAYLINGETPMAERSWIMGQLSNAGGGDIELLYITPEMINKNQTLVRALEKLHKRNKLARLVIDEAHCVSQWGHDFRPDYKELGEVRNKIPGVPVMALTATATENVKVDVIHNLKMTGCETFLQSFNRPNLTYEVRPKGKNDEVLADIAETITRSYHEQCGIIYCLSRKTCEEVAKKLRESYRLKAEHYHAQLDSHKKAEVQNKWQKGEHHIIVATIAFGMGIDKPDVRFVFHHSIPKSLEGYYQETGRAGRDGKRSGCYLYFGYKDTATLKRMIDKGDGSYEQKARQKHMLRNVVQFCENRSDCRRVQVLAYFNEYFRREDCNNTCDNCKSDLTFESHDFSEHASWIIKIVRHFQLVLKEKVTVLYCVDILRGDLKRPKSPSHRELPWYGNGSDLDRGEAERLFYRLLGEDALAEDNVINGKDFAVQYIILGRRSTEYENGQRKLMLQVRVSPKGKPRPTRPAQKGKSGNQPHPQSTMVSSPIQSANDRRQSRTKKRSVPVNFDDDSDGFEPVRVAGRTGNHISREMGPPITSDQKLDRLDHLHRAVVEDFEVTAKRYLQEIVVEKGLRSQPFSDQTLREMAISFPKNLRELSAIPGIDPDKVTRYGRQILKLVDNARRRYHELTQDAETSGVVPDPNHHNVINLSSSDEYSDDDLFVDQASNFDLDYPVEDATQNITSRYFPPPPSPGFDPGDEFEAGPSTSKSKSKRPYSKRPPRRKNGGSTGSFRGKGGRSKAKSGDRAPSRSASAPRKNAKAKPAPKSTIGMMPI